MFQFSVKEPKEKVAAIRLLRNKSTTSVAELFKAIEAGFPVLTADFETESLEIEIEDWSKKVKMLYDELLMNFGCVKIEYAPAAGDEMELLNEEEFYNILESERDIKN